MLTITLDQAALEKAITEYIGATALGIDLSRMNVDINLIAGRGDNGMRAEISLAEGNTQPQAIPAADDTPAAVEPPETEEAAEASSEKVVEPFDFGDED